MSRFNQAVYVASAYSLPELPVPTGLEVAFAGRSNAGKSSAINTITGRNRLAFASKTPGRTQLINFFGLGDDRFLVDLPGYGYADVPEHERIRWGQVVGTYVRERVSLRGLVVIMDARHPLKPIDHQLLGWFLPTGRPVHILLTKADKLSRQEAKRQMDMVRGALQGYGPGATVQLFSSLKRTGVEEARALLEQWLELPGAEKEKPPAKGDGPGVKP